MKKYFSFISIFLSLMLLIGCGNKKIDIENNTEQQNGGFEENSIQIDDDIEKENITEELLVEKYKLTDGYVLTEDMIEEIEYNIMEALDSDYIIKNANYEFESNGVKVKAECKVEKNYDEDFKSEKSHYVLNFIIGDKSFNDIIEYQGSVETCVGIIDFDENDDKKELVVWSSSGLDYVYYIYEIENDGLRLIYMGEPFIKVNNRYVRLVTDESFLNGTVVFGYYIYEDGDIKFINRLLNGELATDEKGYYPESFQNIVYTTDASQEWGNHVYPIIENNRTTRKLLSHGASIRILRGYETETELYDSYSDTLRVKDIEIMDETSYLSLYNGKEYEVEKLPKGTILTVAF